MNAFFLIIRALLSLAMLVVAGYLVFEFNANENILTGLNCIICFLIYFVLKPKGGE